MGALLILLYLVVWQPVHSDVARLRDSVQKKQQTELWMQRAAGEVAVLTGGSRRRPEGGGGPLLTVVEQTARQAGLGRSLNRVEPQGRNRARVWLEDASFDALVRWLATIEQADGIIAESVVADPQDAPGVVNVRLVLFQGGGS